ncbi:MAG: CapA family protein [Rhodocyclaceae bacterium]|jgi:poly-gamma-glutamate capsule biosynthesis protein CapA/YwtB (metallophosphatase superfamily)|nr:CapA family protein [Rhodocyclaceae bacterium]MBK6908458.1 CapA family protein [Rhodocyclaceae bacterium]
MMRNWLVSLWLVAGLAIAQPTVRLAFVGDIMLDDGPGKTIAAGGDPLAHFDAWLRAADFAIGNLECPVAASGRALESKIVTFRARPEAMRVLRGRFAALSLANNHAGDYGPEAFLETLGHVQTAGIHPFGGGRNLSEAHAPLWLEKHGLRIALLAYNEYKPRRFEASPTSPGVAWSEDSHVRRDIRAAKAAGAHVVIPFMHWGWENERAPTERQRQLAALMIAAGADAVVGAHPHVTQGAELIAGKPVIWSLGNFVFDGFGPGPGREGWGLEMSVDRHGVSAWRVIHAAIDEAGTPTPAHSPAPCGQRGDSRPRTCTTQSAL